MFGAYGQLHIYYPGQKNRYSREIHEADLQFNHVMSCDIDATHGICAPRARVEVDVAWYHVIALRINLMNISAATVFFFFFLARVVAMSCAMPTSR